GRRARVRLCIASRCPRQLCRGQRRGIPRIGGPANSWRALSHARRLALRAGCDGGPARGRLAGCSVLLRHPPATLSPHHSRHRSTRSTATIGNPPHGVENRRRIPVLVIPERGAPMHKTRIDLSEKTRRKVTDLLNARLADAIDLQAQAKHAHWNVKGPSFIALHELFDDIAENVEEHIDTLAERVTALGGTAEGVVATVAKRTSLDPYPPDITDGLAHVDALASALATFGRKARKAIDESGKLGDADTADLFTGISRDADKYLWFLE